MPKNNVRAILSLLANGEDDSTATILRDADKLANIVREMSQSELGETYMIFRDMTTVLGQMVIYKTMGLASKPAPEYDAENAVFTESDAEAFARLLDGEL
jgi:hypothetical protein